MTDLTLEEIAELEKIDWSDYGMQEMSFLGRRAPQLIAMAKRTAEAEQKLDAARDLICSAAPLAWANTPLSEQTIEHAYEWEKAASEWVRRCPVESSAAGLSSSE